MNKLRISAPEIHQLRSFLDGAALDFGCRPAAVHRNGRFETYAYGDDAELSRLRSVRDGGVVIENLGTLRSAEARMATTSTENRFVNGDIPSGFGRKE